MAAVLILYAERGRALAEICRAQLSLLSFDVAVRRPGPEMRGVAAQDELHAALVIVAVWSADAIASADFRSEATHALNNGRYTGVMAEPTNLTPPFNVIHQYDLAGWNGLGSRDDWRLLVGAVDRLLGQSGTSAYVAATESGLLAIEWWLRDHPTHPLADRARRLLQSEASTLESLRAAESERAKKEAAAAAERETKHRADLKRAEEREAEDRLRRWKQQRDAQTRESIIWLFIMIAIVVGGFFLYRYLFPAE